MSEFRERVERARRALLSGDDETMARYLRTGEVGPSSALTTEQTEREQANLTAGIDHRMHPPMTNEREGELRRLIFHGELYRWGTEAVAIEDALREITRLRSWIAYLEMTGDDQS